jgi:hypothetical protein
MFADFPVETSSLLRHLNRGVQPRHPKQKPTAQSLKTGLEIMFGMIVAG